MTHEEFIEEIASYVKEFAPQYGIVCYSAPIAQACLESAYGTSELAIFARSVFGAKWREEASNGGKYLKIGSEQNPDGSYVSSVMEWSTYEDWRESTHGYFKFLFERSGVTRYNNLKGIYDPETYLEAIRLDGYCTSQKYTENCMRVITENNLTRFDPEKPQPQPTPTGFSNSPLATYYRLSPTHKSREGKKISVFIPHVYVGQVSAKEGVDHFAQNVGGSCTYVIGYDGQIGQSVDEEYKSGCTGGTLSVNGYTGNKIDFEAVTVEIASDISDPYRITDEAKNALIRLMADVSLRNGLGLYKWSNNPNLVGNWDAQNIALHRWFAKKSCPGNYVISILPSVVEEANKIIQGGVVPPQPVPAKPSVANPTIKKNSSGIEAINLQKDLNYLGYKDNSGRILSEDGIFGTCSVQALINFQKSNGLAADGIYGAASYAKMKALLG